MYEVGEFENCVISTGGGAPCFFDNMQYMNEKGITIYIDLNIEQLAVRLEASRADKRPLLLGRTGEELRKFIADGLATRIHYYKQAKYSVSGSDEQIFDRIKAAVVDFS